MRPRLVALIFSVSVLGFGCGEEPEERSPNELPMILAHAAGELEDAGLAAFGYAIGPLDKPVLVVEDDGLVVVAPQRSADALGSDTLVALNEFSDEDVEGATEFRCGQLVITGANGPGLRSVAKVLC